LKEDKFYIPEDWCNAGDGGLIGQDWQLLLEEHTQKSNELYHQCLEELTPVLGRKRAKESARFFKTYNSQITADVQFNMRSFANFLKLRASEHAQVEIRDIAWEMLMLVQGIEGNPFKHTLKMIKP
jgi:thymidylate synthase (FAD)